MQEDEITSFGDFLYLNPTSLSAWSTKQIL